jgi:hypothetical protein
MNWKGVEETDFGVIYVSSVGCQEMKTTAANEH